jgi:lysophospholipase L1-like esterase
MRTVMDDTTERVIPRVIDDALRPAAPGRLLRFLAPVVPGIRATRNQILDHAHYWRLHAEAALEDDRDNTPLMVVLGDSLSQAVGASSIEHSWLHRLVLHESQQRKNRPARIVNLSRSGARIEDVLEVQLPALRAIERPIQLVTCTVGSNDFARGASYSRVERSMRSLMSRLPSESVLATLPAKGSIMAKRLNKTIRSDAAQTRLRVADVDAHLPGWRGRSAGDRFHPNDLGYQSWFAAFADVTSSPARADVSSRPRM